MVSIRYLGYWLVYDINLDRWRCNDLGLVSISLPMLMTKIERAQ